MRRVWGEGAVVPRGRREPDPPDVWAAAFEQGVEHALRLVNDYRGHPVATAVEAARVTWRQQLDGAIR